LIPHTLDQILPSLQSLGVWTYWLLGLLALIEATVLTGIFVPGALAVIAGGILVQRGILDFFDVAWFVGIGSALGAEISYRLGRLTARGLARRAETAASRHAKRAMDLLGRYGGFAMVVSRFLGPVSGFVSFSAAIAGMSPKRFWFWNIASAVPYALILLAAGYFFGDALHLLGAATTRIVLFSLAVLALLGLLWFLVSRIKASLPLVLSLAGSVLRAVRQNPDAIAWAGRHPRVMAIVVRRIDPTRFGGLSATLLAGLFAYLLTLYIGIVLDFTVSGQIVQADNRLATLLFAFRDQRLIGFFTYITALGDKLTVTTLILATTAILLAVRRRDLIAGLWIGVVGNVITVATLKVVFGRPRPELAYFTESSNSFPSGHAAISVAFFAMFFYVLWRIRWLSALSASLAAVTAVFLIGLSRVYLIEHYLSDVLNGYLVGAMWAVIAIAVMEWQRTRRAAAPASALPLPPAPPAPPVPPVPPGRLPVVLAIVALALAGSTYLVASYQKPLNLTLPPAAPSVAQNIPALFARGVLPNMSETIIGTPQEPISLVIVAPDADALQSAMNGAGWTRAEKPGLSNIARAAWAAWTNQPDPAAPITPSFWNIGPNDLAFQKPTADATLRQRHHVRFWKTGYRTPAGGQIFVGTASFDDGLKWGLTHHIDANIDAERDLLASDLVASTGARISARFQMLPPRLGQNFAGDAWFTDGTAVLLQVTPPD
jgi:membrane protein DedA with SNARE-associated domain/membrane-associated phospholipid phosphatase